jgi:hypothetical protein
MHIIESQQSMAAYMEASSAKLVRPMGSPMKMGENSTAASSMRSSGFGSNGQVCNLKQ